MMTQPIKTQRFSEAVAPLVPPRREFVDCGMPVLEGVPRLPSAELFSELQKRLAPARLMPLIESIGDHAVRVVGLPVAVTERLRSRPSPLSHILLFAGTLNLVPVGQLDGGHIAYGLFGRRHARTLTVVATVLMVAMGLLVWPGLLTWALLIALLAGFSHMPAMDDVTPPDTARFALGALAFTLLLLIILPVPGALSGESLDAR